MPLRLLDGKSSAFRARASFSIDANWKDRRSQTRARKRCDCDEDSSSNGAVGFIDWLGADVHAKSATRKSTMPASAVFQKRTERSSPAAAANRYPKRAQKYRYAPNRVSKL
jgi:hypothetical protein